MTEPRKDVLVTGYRNVYQNREGHRLTSAAFHSSRDQAAFAAEQVWRATGGALNLVVTETKAVEKGRLVEVS
jgi:hypothetical protein